MYIKLISDIHNELNEKNYEIPITDKDHETLLIVAGDFNEFVAGIDYLDSIKERFYKIIYVPGNHEFYNTSYFEFPETFRDNFIFGNRGVFFDSELDINFIWATLWVDFENNPLTELKAQSILNDFQYIKFGDNDSYITTFKMKALCKRDQLFIKESVLPNVSNVVITHHPPTHLGSNPEFDRIQNIFSIEMDQYIYDHPEIKLWCHGHTHSSRDVQIGNTRILCNPKGYDKYGENAKFNDQLLIDIKEL